MRRKSTEDFIKNQWILLPRKRCGTKLKISRFKMLGAANPSDRKRRYAAAACIAACVVLVCALAVNKSPKLPASDSLLNTENDAEQDAQIVTDRAGEPESVIGETIPQATERTTSAVSRRQRGGCLHPDIQGLESQALRVCERQPRADGFRFRFAAPRKNKRHGNRRLFAEKYPHGTEHRGQEKRYCPVL